MTAPDPEVERIAIFCASAHQAVINKWVDDPEGSPFPLPHVCWAAVARAVLADRAAQPPVTDGPTLVQFARERAERDAALDRVDVAMRLVAATRSERDGARDRAEAAEAERDALRNLLTDAETERDAARAMVERLDNAENAQRNRRHVAERERDEARGEVEALEAALDDQRDRRKRAEAEREEAWRQHDALRARLDAMRRDPTEDELDNVACIGNAEEVWRYVRDALITAQEPAPESLPAAPSCTRCMDLRVVQILGGSVEPCPSCGPACPHGKRAGDPPCLACAAILADAESVLASIAKGTHFIIRRDEARVLLAELARLRAEKEVKP